MRENIFAHIFFLIRIKANKKTARERRSFCKESNLKMEKHYE